MVQTEKMQVQAQINALMQEYSRQKALGALPRSLKRLTTEAYMLLMEGADNPCSRELSAKLHRMLDINAMQTSAYAPSDVINECFLIELESYDAQSNPNFWAHFLTLTHNWVVDKIYKRHTHIIGKDENGKPIRVPWSVPDITYGNDDGQTSLTEGIADTQPDPAQAFDTDAPAAGAEAKIAALLASVTGFYAHRQSKTGDLEKYKYYRCFTTDYMICFAKARIFDETAVNEQDAFQAMDDCFLDYVMTEECRTLRKIEQTALKTYELLEIPRKHGTIRIPMEGHIFKQYFKTHYGKPITDSALSQQRSEFLATVGIDKRSHIWQLPEAEAVHSAE